MLDLKSNRRLAISCAIAFLIAAVTVSTIFAQDQPAKRKQINLSPGVMADQWIKKVTPIYPPEARAAKLKGDVIVEVLINPDGSVAPSRVVSGDAMLQQAAMDAVKQWEYQPFELHGEAIYARTQVTVKFDLKAKEGAVTENPRFKSH